MAHPARVAWFTSLDLTSLTRSGYYSALVLPELRDFDVELFVDERDWNALSRAEGDARTYCGRRVEHYLNAFRRDEEAPFDYFVYQVEDCVRSAFVEQIFPIYSGVVLFHDLNLFRLKSDSHYQMRPAGMGQQGEGVPFDEHSERIAQWRRRGWSTEIVAAQGQQGAVVAEGAALAVTKNTHAVQELLGKGCDLRVATTVTPVRLRTVREVAEARRVWRSERGWGEEDLLIALASKSVLDDRAMVILEGYLRADFTPGRITRLIWITDDEESRALAQRFLQRIPPGSPAVEIVAVSRWDEYERALGACDLFVGLKFDVLRDVPIGVPLALASGVPCVVSDFGPSSELPDGAVLKISPGRGERRALEELFGVFQRNGGRGATLGECGRRFAEECLTPAGVAEDLRQILIGEGPALRSAVERSRRIVTEAEQKILGQVWKDAREIFPGGFSEESICGVFTGARAGQGG